MKGKKKVLKGTVEGGVAAVLGPADAAGGVEVLADEVAALLEVIDALNAVAPLEPLTEDLGLLDVDPLLPDQMLPHLQHRHRVLVRLRRIEVVRSRLIELHRSLLPPHFSHSLSLSLSPLSLKINFFSSLAVHCPSLFRPLSVSVLVLFCGPK